MAKQKFGIDAGTASIGWAALDKEDGKYILKDLKNDNGQTIPCKGVEIISGVTDSDGKTSAAVRRGFRSARVRINRKRRRKVATLEVLSAYDLCPKLSKDELNNWRYKKKYPCDNKEFIKWQRTGEKGGNINTEKERQPYYLRYLAATRSGMMNTPEGKLQLGRAFYHLVQRRGYHNPYDEDGGDDTLEKFKSILRKLLEESRNIPAFADTFSAMEDISEYKNDKQCKSITSKIKKFMKVEEELSTLKEVIEKELNKEANLGKVAKGIKDLSSAIKESGQPTLGTYFYTKYAERQNNGTVFKIRNRFIHRVEHYEAEFNYICEVQKIPEELKKKLHFAIFYQRPLKSQKGLVAKCPLESKRKRIAKSHPLFEEFRKWESINRIKIKTDADFKLRPLNKDEKRSIENLFDRVGDVEFSRIAETIATKDRSWRYVKDKEKPTADIEFNFSESMSFSGCPTTARMKTVLGNDLYNSLQLLNESNKDEKGKEKLSIEDIWHCLFSDSTKERTYKEIRFAFAKKHFPDIDANSFANIKIEKGYGNLSKSAIKKIIPHLKEGMLYSHAVFMANIDSVIKKNLSTEEKKVVERCINSAMAVHKTTKNLNGIVNNYIAKLKSDENNKNDSIGNNTTSLRVHRNSFSVDVRNWFSSSELQNITDDEYNEINNLCWDMLLEEALDKRHQDIKFISTPTIIYFIEQELHKKFDSSLIDMSNLYHPSAIEVYPDAKDNRLGNPEISSIRNPLFNKIMHQLKRLINRLISEGVLDQNTEINIEMARDMNSITKKIAIERYQKEQEVIRIWAKNKIREAVRNPNYEPNDRDIAKYILYEEQKGKCLYTNTNITPCKIYKDNIYDIEHTIPRSKWNDNSMANKTLANAVFNRDYKKNILPGCLDLSFTHESINNETKYINKESIKHNAKTFLRLYSIKGKGEVSYDRSLTNLKSEVRKYRSAARASQGDAETHHNMMVNYHYAQIRYEYLLSKYKNLTCEEVPEKFTNSQLVDTRIITKYARAYLKSYFNKVNVINGKITDSLRTAWGLQGEYEKKDRSNHIHHCIDAITVACVERGTINRLNEAYKKYEKEYFDGNLSATIRLAEPMDNFAAKMKSLKDEVLVYQKAEDKVKAYIEDSSKSKNLRGALNKANPYGVRKNEDDNLFFVQRISVTKLKTSNLKDIQDDRIIERIKAECKRLDVADVAKLVKDGQIALPEYEAKNSKGKMVKSQQMILKKVRIRSSKTKLNPYKAIRKIDRKEGAQHKHEFYFDKESGSNYEARVYGDLLPLEKGKRKREYVLVNNYNIVKKTSQNEPNLPILYRIKRGDYFIVFNKHYDEIDWGNHLDLSQRLFVAAKFDKVGQLYFKRHNAAIGDIKQGERIGEKENVEKSKGNFIQRRPSTLLAIPTMIDELGIIDIEYSKAFIEKHMK